MTVLHIFIPFIGQVFMHWICFECTLSVCVCVTESVSFTLILLFTDRILQISLLHLNNAVMSSGSLSRTAVQMFEIIFDQYVSSWKRAEEMKRQKEEEESSIYRYKNIGETRTEAERDEMEIGARFPCFEEACGSFAIILKHLLY